MDVPLEVAQILLRGYPMLLLTDAQMTAALHEEAGPAPQSYWIESRPQTHE